MLIKPHKNLLRAQQIVNGLDRLYEVNRRKFSLAVARSILETIRKHLRLQDLHWKPLAPEYKQWKEEQGLDTRTWIARGDLTKLIRIIPIYQEEKVTYLVGIDPYAKHYSGLTAYHLAMIHEYGVPDRGIPSRPLFRPSYEEVRKKFKMRAMTANRMMYEKYFRKVGR